MLNLVVHSIAPLPMKVKCYHIPLPSGLLFITSPWLSTCFMGMIIIYPPSPSLAQLLHVDLA